MVNIDLSNIPKTLQHNPKPKKTPDELIHAVVVG